MEVGAAWKCQMRTAHRTRPPTQREAKRAFRGLSTPKHADPNRAVLPDALFPRGGTPKRTRRRHPGAALLHALFVAVLQSALVACTVFQRCSRKR